MAGSLPEHYNYSGLAKFVEVLESTPKLESNLATREAFKGASGAWTMGKGRWEKTKELWQNGWPEGIEKMREALGRLEAPRVQDLRRRGRWADEGDELSRERLLAGHYETAWRTTSRVSRVAPKPVRICVDVEAHAGYGQDSLFWRGASGVLLAESLGKAGYPVEVIATSGAAGMGMMGGGYRQYITVTVKQFTEPMYLPSLIATTAHTAFLRVGVFAHNIHYMPSKHTGGMGYSLNTSGERVLAELGILQPGVRVVAVPRMVLSFEEAQKWVHKTVAELERKAVA